MHVYMLLFHMPVGYWHCWLSSTADCFALVQSSQAQQPNRICVMSYDSHLFPSPQSCHGSSHAGWTFANMAASDAFCRIMNFSEKHQLNKAKNCLEFRALQSRRHACPSLVAFYLNQIYRLIELVVVDFQAKFMAQKM